MRLPSVRSVCVLLRISNLPTLWTNACCGWWLAGGGDPRALAWSILGLSLLYSAGMVLNDAWDADRDRVERPDRPIAAGQVDRKFAFVLGYALMGLGLCALVRVGAIAWLFGFGLAMAILLYEEIHKKAPAWGAVTMGFCRTLAVVVGGAASEWGGSLATWIAAGAVGIYVAAISIVARDEDRAVTARVPVATRVLLLAPLGAGAALLWGELHESPLASWLRWGWTLLPLGAWLVWTVARMPRNRMRAVGDLLSGLCLADLALAAFAPGSLVIGFLGAFILCLVLRRSVPAT